MAILDSNSDPGRHHPSDSGNDDALRAIQTYCDLIGGAVLDGIQAEMSRSGVDLGESVEAPVEEIAEVAEEIAPAAAEIVAAPVEEQLGA